MKGFLKFFIKNTNYNLDLSIFKYFNINIVIVLSTVTIDHNIVNYLSVIFDHINVNYLAVIIDHIIVNYLSVIVIIIFVIAPTYVPKIVKNVLNLVYTRPNIRLLVYRYWSAIIMDIRQQLDFKRVGN